MKSRLLVALAGAFLLSAVPAQGALFLGNTVRLTRERPLGTAVLTQDVVVTDPGVETKLGSFNIDLSDDTIRIAPDPNVGIYVFPDTFNGYVINDILGVLPAFTSVTLDPSSPIVPTSVTFNANSIFVDLSNVSFPLKANPDFILLRVGTSAVATIPEPATASLGLLGLAGLMMRRRRVA